MRAQEPANDVGGPPTTAAASQQQKADIAKDRVMTAFRNGLVPSKEAFITRREDGEVCACVLGALAFEMGSALVAQKQASQEAAINDRDVRMRLSSDICQGTNFLAIGEVLALEEGYMGWDHGRFSGNHTRQELTEPFFRAGQEIAKEVQAQV